VAYVGDIHDVLDFVARKRRYGRGCRRRRRRGGFRCARSRTLWAAAVEADLAGLYGLELLEHAARVLNRRSAAWTASGCSGSIRHAHTTDFIQKINIRRSLRMTSPCPSHELQDRRPAEALIRPRTRPRPPPCWPPARGHPPLRLGGGANILVGDKGYRHRDGHRPHRRGADRGGRPGGAELLVAGAACRWTRSARGLSKGLGGLEDFAGMPGSVAGPSS